MNKECLECNTEIIEKTKVYIEGIEVCPYCFTILDIPIIEKNIFNFDLIDTILKDNIVKQIISNLDSEKYLGVPLILLLVFLMVFAITFPLIVSLLV